MNRGVRIGTTLLCAAFIVACGDGSVSPPAEPDAGVDTDTPAPPEDIAVDTADDVDTVGPPAFPPFAKTVTWSWYEELVDDEPRTFAAVLGTQVLVQRLDGTTELVAASTVPDPLVGVLGAIGHAGRLADGMPVVHAVDGLHLLIGGTWYASPANEALPLALVTDLAVEPRGLTEALWLASDSGLIRLFDDQVDLLTSDTLPTTSATLSVDRDPGGSYEIWVSASDMVFSLEDDGLDVGALHLAELDPGSVVATGGGFVWAATDSVVLRLAGAGVETRWSVPDELGAPSAALGGVDGAWIWFGDDPWYLEGESFGPLESGHEGTPIDAAPGGVLLVEADDELFRIQVGDGQPPPPPTWTGEIESIAEARCWSCHVPDTYTGPTQLATPEDWQTNASKIVDAISGEEPAMPLGQTKLQNVQVAMIQAWMDAGFPASPEDLGEETP